MQAFLYLRIQGRDYLLKFLSPHPSLALTAWRLTRENKHRDVRLTPEGKAECDCEDFHYRRSKRGGDCKHVAALRQVCLLPEARS